MIDRLRGVFVPLLTPLDGQASVDLESLARLVEHVLAGGANGLWVCGTSGEFYGLSDAVRDEIVALVVAQVDGRVPVVAQVGDTSTARTVALGRAAAGCGADALAVVLPYYLEWTQTELCDHLRAVADGTGAPVLLYQHPASLPNVLSEESTVALATEGTICGLKDSSPDLESFEALLAALRRSGSDLACFHGAGATAQRALEAGAAGIVSIISNVVPRPCAELAALVREGRTESARALQHELNAVADSMRAALATRTTWAPMIAASKFVLAEIGVLSDAGVAAPLAPLGDDERTHLVAHAVPLAKRLLSHEAMSEELR